MNILHITSHMGGGVGTVIMGWVDNDKTNTHKIMLLDYANEKSIQWANEHQVDMSWNERDKSLSFTNEWIEEADVVICHIYENPMMDEFLSRPIPDCRLAFWCHKNYDVPAKVFNYPDRYYNTSPVQGAWDYIWSTGNMKRFLDLEKVKHEGFNVGTVVSPKLHPQCLKMTQEIKKAIPEARFTIIGDLPAQWGVNDEYNSVGKVDDVAQFLSTMDVLFYPLRRDHYGTGEQAIGESMASGIVPVCMNNFCERIIIQDGKNGFLCNDEEDCINSIFYLYKNPSTRARMENRAKKRSKELYDIDFMISQWHSVFDDMIKQPKKERLPL